MKNKIVFKSIVFFLLVIQMFSGIAKPTYAISTPVLTTTAVSTTQIHLNWTPVPDANLYELWRKVNDSPNFDLLATQSEVTLSDNVSPYNKYDYKVIAVTGSVYSEPSNISTVYTDLMPPSIPNGLTAASTVNSVTLNWSASTDNWGIEKYDIYSKSGDQPFTRIGSATSTTFVHSNLYPNTTYYYYVKAVDRARLESGVSNEASVSTLVDNEPPQAPAGLTANVVSDTRIDLSWTQPSDNIGVVSYVLYKSAPNTDGNYTELTTNNTNYSITGLLAGTSYYFKVKAKDGTGNVSGFSTIISAATQADSQSPTPPVIWAQATSSSKVKLTWSGATDNVGVTNYDIYRAKGTTDSFSKISSSATSPYYDSTTKDTIYRYYIVAKDSAGNSSSQSNTVTVKTNGDTQLPSQPVNLSATVKDNEEEITLTWNFSTDNLSVKGYKIYRAVENGNFYWITTTTTNSYNDTGLTAHKDYKYYIKSYDEAGNESASSNTVTLYTSTEDDCLKTIEPVDGGILTITGLVDMEIPGDALSNTAQYKIEKRPFSNYNTSGYKTFGQPVKITVRIESTDITEFNRDLTLDFYYSSSELGALSTAKIGIYYWDDANDLWIAVPSNPYSSKGKVTSEINHPAVFALLGDVTAPPVPTLSNSGTSSVQQITLTGSGEENSKIDIMLNGSIFTVNANLKGYFAKTADLVNGRNEIKLKARDAAANESEWSPVYAINYSTGSGLLDIYNHWAKNNITRAVQLGITKGYENQTFQPNRNITRAEFCKFVVAALGHEPASDYQLNFTDSGSIPAWSRGFVSTAVEKGLISGYSDGSFRANREITRQEMAAIIINAMNLNNEAKLKQNNKSGFKDAARIQTWARGSVIVAVEKQIIKGYSDNTFRPTNTATRAEAVTMIINMIDNSGSI